MGSAVLTTAYLCDTSAIVLHADLRQNSPLKKNAILPLGLGLQKGRTARNDNERQLYSYGMSYEYVSYPTNRYWASPTRSNSGGWAWGWVIFNSCRNCNARPCIIYQPCSAQRIAVLLLVLCYRTIYCVRPGWAVQKIARLLPFFCPFWSLYR